MRRPTYTITSIMKKAFRPGERSLSRSEIVERLEVGLQAAGIDGNGEEFLTRILHIPNAPIRVGRTEAIIELVHQPHQLFDLAYRYLLDAQVPKTAEQIFREVRKRTQFSWNQIARILILERDPRFVQYENDDRWFLAEWKLANDHVYEYLVSAKAAPMPLRAVSYTMEREIGLSPKEYVFLPELDDRFQVETGTVHLTSAEQSEATESEADAEQRQAEAEVAAATTSPESARQQLSLEDDWSMNSTAVKTNVQKEVNDLLKQALHLLENRNQEMGQEVVARFQESDMRSIEGLMKEKQHNEQVVLGIKQVLASLAQQ
ncbi:hypothetical protein LOK74_03770 [Brevibacillus humidisoli]|uniref:hypothetical protein n=1 Tax=Brevibacillus humidisoli TaxID=2895522 RepID=UPI001E2ABB33|nr:hypothetical protein [Brevibacillus humidisoli]UFJ41642.1 hypothetical protein LOK74_03770 [Brevibacillus humidisoli]